MKKTDYERLVKILRTWNSLNREIMQRNITEKELLTDPFLQWAVTTPVYNIGEQVYQLSPELKNAYPQIPWSLVSGLRHRLVHDYDGINWNIIADVIFNDLPVFAQQVENMIASSNL